MSLSEYALTIISSFTVNAPYIAGLIAAVVIAVILLRRGGGQAERFLLAGFCVLLVGAIIRILVPLTVLWRAGESGLVAAALRNTVLSFLLSFVSLAGIVCLAYAFWAKSKVKS